MPTPLPPPWTGTEAEALRTIQSRAEGLTSAEAGARQADAARKRLQSHERTGMVLLFLRQFKSPISLILIASAVLAYFLADAADGSIILVIVFLSGLLGFWQEASAGNATAKLLAIVKVRGRVWRDGAVTDVPTDEIVPGDVVAFSAGSIVPGDCRLLEAKDLFADEASLTGESYPAEKRVETLPADTELAKRTNMLFMGTHILSGQGKAVVLQLGTDTELGKITDTLKVSAPETDFEAGVRRFGYLLIQVTLSLVVVIFALNLYLERPLLESFLFSLAIAVGLTPQLLPAIISVNLAQGARAMAQVKVIVKRLSSIENFGSMTVLCTDKTGTLTSGEIGFDQAVDAGGTASEETRLYVYLNAALQSGFVNPMDAALCKLPEKMPEGMRKLDELAYDFTRKRLSVLVNWEGEHRLITKGAVPEVMGLCTQAKVGDALAPMSEVADKAQAFVKQEAAKGCRVIAVASKVLTAEKAELGDESSMTLLGFVTFVDPVKPEVPALVQSLHKAGVSLKMITGDNALVAEAVAKKLGIEAPRVLTGRQLQQLSGRSLARRVRETDVFAEIEPNGKESILLALKKAGAVVGYMGDGINDAPALHAADVGISVNDAVEVAKESADIILLENDLGVLLQGIQKGRITFSNTLKYVFMATSANFGNMFSMAGASLLLPFLPLLPSQILLTNLLEDLPQVTISTDSVDPEFVQTPHRWNIGFIRKFMIVFGLISSVFDYATFGVFYLLLKADAVHFRTGWLTESVLSASLVVLVVRTQRPIYKSRPSTLLTGATLAVIALTLALPYTPLARVLGLAPLAWVDYAWIGGIVVAYMVLAEVAKSVFYRYVKL